MKAKLILLSLFLFLVCDCFGQIMFQKVIVLNYGSGANAVQQTTDGGYVMAGFTTTIASEFGDVYLIKTNSWGDTLWTKTYSGIDGEEGTDVHQTTDGGYVVVSFALDPSIIGDLHVIKTNAVGDTLWTKGYGGVGDDYAYSIQQTNDSGYIITGSTTSFGIGNGDVYLIKINAVGDITWTKTYGGNALEAGESVRQTVDSGYIICGYTYSFGAGGTDVYLIKTNSIGDTLWTKTYGGTNDDLGFSVRQTKDSGYIVAGFTGNGDQDTGDVYLIKTNANGDTLWTKTYGRVRGNSLTGIEQTIDSGYIITGSTNSFGAVYADVYLIKTNSKGDTLWTKAYGGTDYAYGFSVQQTTDGGYIIVGTTDASIPEQDIGGVYLIKTDANGNSGCNQGTPAMTVSSIVTQVGSPHTIVGNGGTASSIAIIVGSGGTDSTLCLTTGINKQSINNTISLYPNPAIDQLVVTGDWKESSNMKLTVYNMLGETIYTEAINSKQEIINCKLFPSGIYFVTVANENEQWVGRFVKE